MAITQYYVDPAIAGDSGTGTIGDPYGDLQYALNQITRNATDGDQINIKAGTAEVLAASLTLATYGTPSGTGQLILRGYTSAANDGGIGEIDCGGATMFTETTHDYIMMADLEIHTFGDNDGVVLDRSCLILHCEIHKGASSPSGKSLLKIGNYSNANHCYIHDAGSGTAYGLYSAAATICNNHINIGADASTGYGIYSNANSIGGITGNIVVVSATGQRGIRSSTYGNNSGNILYSSTANTTYGLYLSSSLCHCENNIFVGFSGVGGKGVEASDLQLVGYNAFYNNTANYSISDQTFIDLTANDVALGADPFTDAANGDFSLTAAAKTALAAKGFPTSYFGAHANTVPNLNIGPIQMAAGGAAGGGFPILGGSVVR